MVTVSCGARVPIGTATTRLAVVANGERIPIEAIGTSATVGALVADRARIADVFLWSQAVLVIVDCCHLARWREVVGGDVQRALAWVTVIGPAQLCVSIKSFGTGVAMLSHRVVLTLAALEGERIAGCSMSVALALSANSFVDGVLDPGVSVAASLTREAGVTWGAGTLLHCPSSSQAERGFGTKFHGCCVQGSLQLV